MSTVERNVYCASYSLPYLGNESLVNAMHKAKNLYKARQLGIACLTTEESYTSKCSFLDNEEMCHHDRYACRRTKRGLFVSASSRKINADLNAALNMIRKVIPNAFLAQGIEALVVAPVRLLWRTKSEIGTFH